MLVKKLALGWQAHGMGHLVHSYIGTLVEFRFSQPVKLVLLRAYSRGSHMHLFSRRRARSLLLQSQDHDLSIYPAMTTPLAPYHGSEMLLFEPLDIVLPQQKQEFCRSCLVSCQVGGLLSPFSHPPQPLVVHVLLIHIAPTPPARHSLLVGCLSQP